MACHLTQEVSFVCLFVGYVDREFVVWMWMVCLVVVQSVSTGPSCVSACSVCPPGFYSAKQDVGQCVPCTRGMFSPGNAVACDTTSVSVVVKGWLLALGRTIQGLSALGWSGSTDPCYPTEWKGVKCDFDPTSSEARIVYVGVRVVKGFAL